MRKFIGNLHVKNKEKFKDIYYNRMKSYLRRDIYEHVLSHTENDYFSLDEFNKRINDLELVKKMSSELIPELERLGWKCKTSFGGTGLFIFSSDEPPSSCWEESEIL
jgi:hypothetical protein